MLPLIPPPPRQLIVLHCHNARKVGYKWRRQLGPQMLDPLTRLHHVVQTTAWLDSKQFRQFSDVPVLPPFVAPLDVVLHTHDPQRIFFAVPERDGDRETFRALGALHRPDDERCCGRVPTILAKLRDRIPDPEALPASVGMSLAALYNRLMPRLIDGDTDVPVLMERAGRLAWLVPGEEAWLARREERQEIRRFFADLALVAAEYREGLPERLGVASMRLRKRIRPEVDGVEETPLASRIRHAIEPHLPVFAAVVPYRPALSHPNRRRLSR